MTVNYQRWGNQSRPSPVIAIATHAFAISTHAFANATRAFAMATPSLYFQKYNTSP
jgi:hypothetical protein